MKSFLFTFSIFLLIFGPFLNIGLGYFGDTVTFFCVLLILRRIFTHGLPMSEKASRLFSIICMLILYALLASTFFTDKADQLTGFFRTVRILIMFAGFYSFVLMYCEYYRELSSEKLLRDLFIAIAIHAILINYQFANPEFRQLLYQFTFADNVVLWQQEYRMAGLTNAGGAQLSLYQSFGFIIFPFLALDKSTKFKVFNQRTVYFFLLIPIFASLVLTGRSGVIAAMLFTPLAMYLAARDLKQFTGQMGYLLVIGVVGFAFTASYLLILERMGGSKAAAFDFAVVRVLQVSRGEDDTVSFLIDHHLFIPQNIQTLLVGDIGNMEPMQNTASRAVDSDIGYVRILFAFGTIGSFIHYFFYFESIRYLYWFRHDLRSIARLGILLHCLILLFNFKEIFVFTRIGFGFTSLLTCCALVLMEARSRLVAPLSGDAAI